MKLYNADRAAMLRELEAILQRTGRLRETFTVAASRGGTTTSGWTDARLLALMRAAEELRVEVQKAPLADA